jgi:hypothetical protein
MRFFEFAITPQTSSSIKDLEYLLTNADVDPNALTKALNFLKKDSQKNQDPLKKPKDPTQQEPAQQEPTQQAPADQENNVKEATASTNLVSQVLALAQAAPPDELEKILFYLKLSAFKDMATEIIKNKIKIKAAAIKEQIHLAITDLAGKTSVKAMTDFLNDCKNGGVVDAESMITGNDGILKPIPVSRDDYRDIVERLLNTSLGGASASGKGEFGLAFSGISATKGEKDITIGEIDIEVKATQRKTDFFFKGQTGFEAVHTKAALSKLVSALNSVGGQFQNNNEIGKGGISQLNLKTITALNPYFVKLGQAKVSQLLVDIVNVIHNDHNVSQFSKEISAAVNEDGTVDYGKLVSATSKVSFYYYQAIEKHPGILMLNITNMTYVYQANPEDFSKLVDDGTIGAGSAIDFRTATKGSMTFKLN